MIVFCVPAFKVALIVPPTILPVTVRLSNVPELLVTDVVLTLPACTVPVTLIFVNPLRFVIFALVILAVVAVILLTFAKFVIEF